jgi:hypothetical protein
MKILYKPFFYLFFLLLVALSLLVLQERKLFDIRTLAQIDPIPHTQKLVNDEKYAQAEEYLSYFMEYPYVRKNPESHKLFGEIKAKRDSYEYQGEKLIEGVLKGKSDEDIGKTSAIVSDFFLIGDIRDLSIEGVNFYNDKKVDGVVVALSSLGIIATLSTVYTLGATSSIKTSISVLKYAKRADKIPPWLGTTLVKQAKIAKDSYSVKHIEKLLEPIYKLYEKVGLNQTLELISKTKSFKELTMLSHFTTRFGKKSHILLQLTHNKALSYHKNLTKVSNRGVLYASTYGEKGLKALSRIGESKFMVRMGNRANLFKTGYKGNLNSIFNYFLKHIPSWLLFTVVFLGLFYFIRDFYLVLKRII